MMPIVSPIDRGDTKKTLPPFFKRLWFLGYLLWFLIGPSKWKLYYLSIKKQIKERGIVPAEAWDSSERHAIANKIEEILAENCWGEKFSFHPTDPYVVIGEFEVGDLSELEALMEIEDFYDVKFPEKGNEFFENPTFGDVVSFIEKNSDKTA